MKTIGFNPKDFKKAADRVPKRDIDSDQSSVYYMDTALALKGTVLALEAMMRYLLAVQSPPQHQAIRQALIQELERIKSLQLSPPGHLIQKSALKSSDEFIELLDQFTAAKKT